MLKVPGSNPTQGTKDFLTFGKTLYFFYFFKILFFTPKNYRFSNTFWLYQHGVRNEHRQSYSHLKLEILIWVTLYDRFSNLQYELVNKFKYWRCGTKGFGFPVIIGVLVIPKTKELKNVISRLQDQVINCQLSYKINGCTGIQTAKTGSKLEMISL